MYPNMCYITRGDMSVILVCFFILCLPCPLQVKSTDTDYTTYPLHNSTDWSGELEKFIGSQTKIKFMPGNYQMKHDILIANVSNFSIEGDSALHVEISCTNLSSWTIVNSVSIEIKNVRFFNCGSTYDTHVFKGTISSEIKAAIFIYNVSSISMINITIGNSCGYGIIALNIVGKCTFEHLIIHGNDTISTFCERLSNNTLFGGMVLLNLRIKDNITLHKDTTIDIKECLFFSIQTNGHGESINLIEYFNSSVIGLVLHQAQYHIEVNIENVNITSIVSVKRSIISVLYSINNTSNVTITNSTVCCTSANYSAIEVGFKKNATKIKHRKNFTVRHKLFLISNQFCHNKAGDFFTMKYVYNNSFSLELKNNLFENNTVKDILFKTKAVVPWIVGYLNFSNNKANIVFSMSNYMLLNEGAVLYFSNNTRPSKPKSYRVVVKKNNQSSPECPFQFINSTNNVSIIFYYNTDYYRTMYGNSLFGCIWIPKFPNREKLLPSEVYSNIIQYRGDDNRGISGWENSICLCNDNSDHHNHNCLRFEPITAYPGETISIGFMHYYFDIAIYTTFNESIYNEIAPPCGISSPKTDLVFNYCNKINYTVTSNSSHSMCLLLLRTATKENTIYAFRIHLKNCSLGFVHDHNEGVCKCHPEFASSIHSLKCDISNEAFLRPAGGWIGNDSNDITYTNDCRLDYCLQYPSWVQLTNPNSQCLPGRRGVACGECAQGLSAVLGTSRCKKCTNHWLFLLPVFAIAGPLLVLALFVLNLTVVDGDIYGFILMVNILSTHDTRVFPSTRDPSWVLVSLFNLDLGIEVCFYDGMTAYAATWLRLIFPIYVLLIVVTLAFISRYFQVIEKITRKRVIPVIATLYLLSYNKLMLVTFRGLLSYTKIYYLLMKDAKFYWSLDTSVPLFGVEFLLLFICCLILFLLVILPTNVLLISGKTVYRFKIIVIYLKPFLDAYQAPFKDNCRYLLGLELFIRSLVFASVSFTPENTAAIYTAILLVYLVYFCQAMPFKSKFNSVLYCSYLLYMGAYVILFARFYPFNKYQKTYRLIFNLVCYTGFLQFLGIVAIHFWKYNLRHFRLFINCENCAMNWKSRCQLKLNKRKGFFSPKQQVKLSAFNYENFQEELLALEPDI